MAGRNHHVISMTQTGNFKSSFKFLKAMREKNWLKHLDKYGQMGVDALKAATPKDTGLTASSWNYEIKVGEGGHYTYINWYNTNVIKDYFNVALRIQTGHGTKEGVWIEGIDYINPALQPVFDKIAGSIWEEVKSA